MINFLHFIYQYVNTPLFVCIIIAFSFIIKCYLLSIIIPRGVRETTIKTPLFFLLGTLIGSMGGDLSWIIKLLRSMDLIHISYGTFIFCIRMSWALLILQYQSLAFFIESLTHKIFTFRTIHRYMGLTSSLCILYFIIIAFCDESLANPTTRNAALSVTDISQAPLEIQIMHYIDCYLLHILIAIGLTYTLINFYFKPLPKILKIQLRMVLLYFISPYIAVEAIQALLVAMFNVENSMYCIVASSTLLITCCIYFCIHQIIMLRFLNFENHVNTDYNSAFFNNFKIALEELSHATTLEELAHITQSFFNTAFNIGIRHTTLYVYHQQTDHLPTELSSRKTTVESFIHNHGKTMNTFIRQRRILMYDELEFSNFYTNSLPEIIEFMNALNADIFLPIYDKDAMIAYIIVERNSRTNLYGKAEYVEMLIFAHYLANILNLLQHRNLTVLMYKEKEIKEELFLKQQEINQYKESLKTFLRTSEHKDIGIIFYKNNRFIFGNKAAKTVLDANSVLIDGNSFIKSLQQIAQQVATYKTEQTSLVSLKNNQKIVIYGVPNIEQNTTIIMLYHPEISDILARNIALLKDPTTWDYLLYLETTLSGQLVNRLIPGSGEELLNFKIELLKTALCQKTILLEMPQDDLLATVEIIHHISLRTVLQTLTITKENSTTIASELFGINPLIAPQASPPLLDQLDTVGTLFIQNIELLDMPTQQHLADFLMYGWYHLYNGDQPAYANVRVICSTQQNLQALVQEGKFNKKLFDELNKTFLSMPSLTTLSEQELNILAQGLADQSIENHDLKSVLTLTDKEKNKLTLKRSSSLHSLKTRIQEIVHEKSKKSLVYQETHVTSDLSDNPELTAASLLGKKALRDPKIMEMLWKRFKNQNQIATFLGVNRSSINRRCKEYGIK